VAGYGLTPRAREGLLDILEYAERRFGTTVAEDVLDRLAAAFAFVAENPGAGHRRADLTRDEAVRFWSVGPALIAYRMPGPERAEILFVERADRDWERAFDDEMG
jgi:plasmid stabilization system protein ParE